MNTLERKHESSEVLAKALYEKAVVEIANVASDLSRITIHGKSNFASAYLSAEGESDVFERLVTTKFHVQTFDGNPVVVAHFIFKDPPEHERIFIKIMPKIKTSEHVRFVISDDGELDVDELRPLSYNEVTHLLLDLSLALEARK